MTKVRSLKSDKSDALVTRAQVVGAVRHMVGSDPSVNAEIRRLARMEIENARRPSLWRRVVAFFRVGR